MNIFHHATNRKLHFMLRIRRIITILLLMISFQIGCYLKASLKKKMHFNGSFIDRLMVYAVPFP